MKKLVIVGALILWSCSSQLRVYSDFDKDVSLKQYHTYSWAANADIEKRNNPLYYNELNDKRIKAAVDEQLCKKNFNQVSENSDAIIHYHLVIDNKTSFIQEPYGIYGPYWMRGGNVIQYTEGTLIIDIMDAENKSLIWRGWAVSVVDDSGQMQPQVLSKAIEKIFEKYPGTN